MGSEMCIRDRSQTVRDSHQRYRHREGRLARFANEAPSLAPGAVLFLGSSTVERWDLIAHFPGVHTVNQGIGDEDLALLHARWKQNLPPDPAGLVLYAGSIDFRRYGHPPDLLAGRVGALLDEIIGELPAVPILVLGLLSELDFPESEVIRLTQTNTALSRTCSERGVTFLTTARPPVVRPNGSLDPMFAADRLHLSGSGYAELVNWLRDAGGPVSKILFPSQ